MAIEGLYLAGILTASVIGIAVALLLYSDDAAVSTRLFVAVVALHSVVGLLVVGQLLAPDPLVVPIYAVQKPVAAAIMPAWFLFALAYTRREQGLSRPLVSAVGGYYVVLAGLELTNPWHMLLWSSYDTIGSLIPHLVGTPTLLYSVVTLPLAVFYFAGLALVGAHALSGPKVSRRQSAYLFGGYVPPFFVLIAGMYRVLPGPVDGGLVIVSTVTLAAVGWAVFRHRLFDLLPLARETVFEAVEDAVIVVDDDLRILDYNEAAVETFPRLAGAEGVALADRIPALVARDGSDDPFVSSLVGDGEDGVRHYDSTVSALDVGGEIRGYGLVLRDVTESRTHIRDLEQQTERLERFASTLSHDIRNPLNVAEGRVQMAMDTGDLDHLPAASRAHDRIFQIIEDLLELAQHGRRIDDQRQLRVGDVFRSAWETTDTGSANVEIDDGADLVVYGDPTRLQRAFENVIRNAVEHGSPAADRSGGGIDGSDAEGADRNVTVTFSRHADGFYIEDDGPGVSPEDREQVFEYEFSTADEGTGLGLALVDEIAQAHGWQVEMREGSAGGARVVFSEVESIDPERRVPGSLDTAGSSR